MRKFNIKNKQMVVIKGLPPEQCKDILLTLAWKSDVGLVTRCLVERCAIDPVQFAREVGTIK